MLDNTHTIRPYRDHEEVGDASNGMAMDDFGNSFDVAIDPEYEAQDFVEALSHLTNEQANVVLLSTLGFNAQEISKSMHYESVRRFYYVIEQSRAIFMKDNVLGISENMLVI